MIKDIIRQYTVYIQSWDDPDEDLEKKLGAWEMTVKVTTRWDRLECSWTMVADSLRVRRPCWTRHMTSYTVSTCLSKARRILLQWAKKYYTIFDWGSRPFPFLQEQDYFQSQSLHMKRFYKLIIVFSIYS